jgi:hypothetical protein
LGLIKERELICASEDIQDTLCRLLNYPLTRRMRSRILQLYEPAARRGFTKEPNLVCASDQVRSAFQPHQSYMLSNQGRCNSYSSNRKISRPVMEVCVMFNLILNWFRGRGKGKVKDCVA